METSPHLLAIFLEKASRPPTGARVVFDSDRFLAGVSTMAPRFSSIHESSCSVF